MPSKMPLSIQLHQCLDNAIHFCLSNGLDQRYLMIIVSDKLNKLIMQEIDEGLMIFIPFDDKAKRPNELRTINGYDIAINKNWPDEIKCCFALMMAEGEFDLLPKHIANPEELN